MTNRVLELLNNIDAKEKSSINKHDIICALQHDFPFIEYERLSLQLVIALKDSYLNCHIESLLLSSLIILILRAFHAKKTVVKAITDVTTI